MKKILTLISCDRNAKFTMNAISIIMLMLLIPTLYFLHVPEIKYRLFSLMSVLNTVLCFVSFEHTFMKLGVKSYARFFVIGIILPSFILSVLNLIHSSKAIFNFQLNLFYVYAIILLMLLLRKKIQR